MGFVLSSTTLERLYLILLSAAVIDLSTTCKCNDFNLKQANSDQDSGDEEHWNCYSFSDSTDCLMCFYGDSGDPEPAELVLPCWPLEQVQFWYRFRPPGQESITVNVEEGAIECQTDYAQALDLDIFPEKRLRWGQNSLQRIQQHNISSMTNSHRVRITSGFSPRSLVCLTNVTFTNITTPDGSETDRLLTTASVATTGTANITTPDGSDTDRLLTTASVATTGTANNTTSDGSETDRLLTTARVTTTGTEQKLSTFSTLSIIIIIGLLMIIFGMCAVLAVFILRRKSQENQQENIVNAGMIGVQTKRKDSNRSDDGVMSNPMHGQDVVDDKNDEYHSYTEIKKPTNSELIYNSAYESFAPN